MACLMCKAQEDLEPLAGSPSNSEDGFKFTDLDFFRRPYVFRPINDKIRIELFPKIARKDLSNVRILRFGKHPFRGGCQSNCAISSSIMETPDGRCCLALASFSAIRVHFT